jgi:hypothetical protein
MQTLTHNSWPREVAEFHPLVYPLAEIIDNSISASVDYKERQIDISLVRSNFQRQENAPPPVAFLFGLFIDVEFFFKFASFCLFSCFLCFCVCVCVFFLFFLFFFCFSPLRCF